MRRTARSEKTSQGYSKSDYTHGLAQESQCPIHCEHEPIYCGAARHAVYMVCSEWPASNLSHMHRVSEEECTGQCQ